MDDYIKDCVVSTWAKINYEGELPAIQYDAYIDMIAEPYLMADTDADALLVLDCISDVFKRRYEKYEVNKDADIAAYAMIVASAFRSRDRLMTSRIKTAKTKTRKSVK